MREHQRARGEKPRYDGRWRPENAKRAGLTPPAGVQPVLRFRNPDEGAVTFIDLVKGPITVANGEIDDLVILRADGVPTYNFGVVVDDLDMDITHVIRGDDHVNNTPRQVNIFRALGAPLPQFAHAPMILGADGERLSKRHGAVSVMQYPEDGYLPEALFNYLARLGWTHGDAEKFTASSSSNGSTSRMSASRPRNSTRPSWRGSTTQYIKEADNGRLAALVAPLLERDGGDPGARPAACAGGGAAQGSRHHAGGHGRCGGDVLPTAGTAQGAQRRALLRRIACRPAGTCGRAWSGSNGSGRSISEAVKAVVAETQPQDAENRHAAAGDGPRGDADAVDRRQCWNCSAATQCSREWEELQALSGGKLIRVYRRRRPV